VKVEFNKCYSSMDRKIQNEGGDCFSSNRKKEMDKHEKPTIFYITI
jgi:hypothetical protein